MTEIERQGGKERARETDILRDRVSERESVGDREGERDTHTQR